MQTVVRYLQALFDAGTAAGWSDAQLLGRFVERQEAAALEALVQRHGPMVWGVCHRVLRDHHDAEDAFQATFLVLARKAATVRPREKVGNWLYGVAYQTARKARAKRARRQQREAQVPDVPEPAAASPPGDGWAELIDQEVSRLPAKYRTPLVLCELEGKTHGEAAVQLGWPVGTVSGRLSRARVMLADRLRRRGVGLAGGALAALLAQDAAAAVPASLLAAVVQPALRFAAGGVAGVSAEVLSLAQEVMRSMLMTKIRLAAAFLSAALLAVTLAGAGFSQDRTAADAKAAAGTYRVKVNEVLRDDSTVVAQIDFETPPGATIEVVIADKPKGSKLSASTPARTFTGPARPQVTVFADQIELKEGSTNAVKFLIGYKYGGISSSSSETIPLPAGKTLADVLTVPIKAGEYKFEEPVTLATFQGATYRLVVHPPQ